MFPSPIIWALEEFPASCIEIVANDPHTAKEEFDNIFSEQWQKAYDNTIADIGVSPKENVNYYPYDADESYPVEYTEREGKLLVLFRPLLIQYCYGEFCEISYPYAALHEAIQEFRNRHPQDAVSGYIAFPWSDRRCGDIEEYPIGEEKKIYPHMAEIINAAVEGKDLNGQVLEDDDCLMTFEDILSGELESCDELEQYEEMLDFLDTYTPYLSETAKTILRDCISFAAEEMDDEEIQDYVEQRLHIGD